MDIFDQILELLELERELGGRTVEMDRALLVPPVRREEPVAPSAPAEAEKENPKPVAKPISGTPRTPSTAKAEEPAVRAKPETARTATAKPASAGGVCDIAFYTGCPLSAKGMDAMDKIFAAVGKLRPGIDIRLNEEVKSMIVVLLGSAAVRHKLPPGTRIVRGAWIEVDGVPAVTAYSPDYIFSHFTEGEKGMNAAKLDLWNTIKSAVARLPGK